MDLRLEGHEDSTTPPPYMTQPKGPRFASEIQVFGTPVPVEIVIENGIGWVRWKINDNWRLWRRMDDKTGEDDG